MDVNLLVLSKQLKCAYFHTIYFHFEGMRKLRLYDKIKNRQFTIIFETNRTIQIRGCSLIHPMRYAQFYRLHVNSDESMTKVAHLMTFVM